MLVSRVEDPYPISPRMAKSRVHDIAIRSESREPNPRE
jgi:hypothetical protein